MILDLIAIDLSLTLLLFIPGYATLIAVTKNKNPFGLLGTLLTSLALSLGVVNFSLMAIDKFNVQLSRFNIIFVLLGISLLGFLIYKTSTSRKKIQKTFVDSGNWLIFLTIMAFSIFLRLVYLTPKIIPHTTDLGHHMYWANFIIKFQQLPIYNIPDVIIGEHIIFGAVSILSGIGIISALPTVFLFIINIFSILAIFLLTKELANSLFKEKSSFTISLLSLMAIGIFYAIASPQTSYVNGGVVGNLMGSFFIPIIFYLFLKAFKEKNSSLAGLGIFLIGVLAYTHHLSTFIFIYSLLGFLLFFLLGWLGLKIFKNSSTEKITPILKTFFGIKSFMIGLFILAWVFLVRAPSYLNLSAIDTAVGDPSKSTRFGLSINNLIHSTGSWRVFYSIIGIVFLFFISKKIIQKKTSFLKSYPTKKTPALETIAIFSLASAWFITIFAMSHWPAWLKVDIISGRIANYLTYPSAILSAFGAYAILQPIFQKNKKGLPALMIFLIIFIPGIISGLFDVSESYPEQKNKEKIEKTVETFRGAKYLAHKTSGDQRILKDHIYLTGDTWIKNFLMRDYEEPLSRSLLKRYNDPIKERETCTRDMVAIPDSLIGKNCFQKTGVKFIILKNGYDTHQFETSNNFSKIFTTNQVVIFQKNE